MRTGDQTRDRTRVWPDDVFEEVLEQLKQRRILNGPKLPLSVWHEVERRDKQLDVMQILFSQLNTETTMIIKAVNPSNTSVQRWAEMFSQSVDVHSPWAAWIRQRGGLYDCIEAAEDGLAGLFNTEWALQHHRTNRYGQNISQRRLLTWFDSNRISESSANELLRMLRSSWWKQEDVECGTLNTLRFDLDNAAKAMVQSVDMRVAADGKQAVEFYWRDPVQALQLVSANSVCRTSNACTFAHPSPQLHTPGVCLVEFLHAAVLRNMPSLPSHRRAALPPSPLPLQHEC